MLDPGLYLARHPRRRDPKRRRAFVVVSRPVAITSRFATVICAPLFTTRYGLATQVAVGVDEGLKHDSAIHGDELVSLPKGALTNYVGSLSPTKITELNDGLRVALALDG